MAPADAKEKARKVINVTSLEQFKTLTSEPRYTLTYIM
jgi:hypothetical protein